MSGLGRDLKSLMDGLTSPTDIESIVGETVTRSTSPARILTWVIVGAALVAITWFGVRLPSNERVIGDQPVAETDGAALAGTDGEPPGTPEIVWTQYPAPPGFAVSRLVEADGQVFGLAIDDIEAEDPLTRLWIASDDLSSWEEVAVDTSAFGMRGASFRAIAHVGSQFFAIVKGESVASGLAETVLVGSPDARLWSNLNTGGATPVAIVGGAQRGLVVLESVDPVGDTRLAAMSTSNGVDWSIAPDPPFTQVGGADSAIWLSGSFFVAGRVDAQDVRLFEFSDSSSWTEVDVPDAGSGWQWLIPGRVGDTLIVYGGRQSGVPVVLSRSGVGEWRDVTPPSFDPRFLPASPLPGLVSSEAGGSALVVSARGPGRSERGEDRRETEPGMLWWTDETFVWHRIDGASDFEVRGYIDAAGSVGDQILVIHRDHELRDASLWVGVVMP